MNFIRQMFRKAGPGVITGAADNDPSGIATYSQTGAQYGYALLWTAFFLLPFQIAIQGACARIGAVSGQGLAAVTKKQYGKVIYTLVALLFIANTINIGADIGAMAAATELIFPGNFYILCIAFTIAILLLEVLVAYKIYSNILKWLTLTLLAYPVTLLMIHAPWLKILKSSFIPRVEYNSNYLFILIGIVGTTISPYLFFWEASHVVEDANAKQIYASTSSHIRKRKFIKNLSIDNFMGMVISQVCAWAIIVITAVVLHPAGVTDIKTAADAAKALEPLLGKSAEYIFALGIVGLGGLAIPILAGSAAYACSEVFGWKWGLDHKLKGAKGFYSVIIASSVLGLAMNFFGINPMKALIYAAFINGIASIPMIAFIGFISNNEKLMKEYKNTLLINLLIMGAFFAMLIATLALVFSFFMK
jgi:NRAMP (natural resistance-associated macrophage protein)-like metal ion transporter